MIRVHSRAWQQRLVTCLIALWLSPVFIACATDRALSADEEFKTIYTREWTWRQAQFGGEDNEDAHEGIRDHLSHVDATTQLSYLRYWQDVQRQLAALDQSQLSSEARVNYQIYAAQINTLIEHQFFKEYEQPLNADTTFWTNLAGTARQPFHTREDYQHYLSQLRDVPRYFDEQMANMSAGLKRGFTPPAVTLAHREGSLTAVTEAASIEANPYYQPFLHMSSRVSEQDQAQLREQAHEVLTNCVVPAYQRLLRFMTGTYIPHARKTLAATQLPNGRAYYQAKVREYTTLDLSPDDIHALGVAEVEKIHAEMLQVMQEIGFIGSFAEFLQMLRTDEHFYAKSPEELLLRAAGIAKEFDGKAADYFGYLPRARFAIKAVPDEIAPFYTAGRGGPGVYLVNTYDLPSRPLYALTALTLHESAPGHAFQMPIALELSGQPEFRQKSYLSGYGEGWALYCERLGLEMGMYKTPYDRFGMLTYQMWRAARLVVDTGIHAKGWTRAQAQQYLHDQTALSDHEIETEVDRYISWPGQALSYYLGAMTIWQARQKAEVALGSRFNIRAFHDAILALGSVPLSMVMARTEQLITAGGTGPYPDME
jgi:uncharacterized protein (DUF885 family)